MSKWTPSDLLTLMAVSMDTSRPVHSRATRMVDLAAARTALAVSSAVPETRTVRTLGTNLRANSRRDWTTSVITSGLQPAAAAQRRLMIPIGPAPLFCQLASHGVHNISLPDKNTVSEFGA